MTYIAPLPGSTVLRSAANLQSTLFHISLSRLDDVQYLLEIRANESKIDMEYRQVVRNVRKQAIKLQADGASTLDGQTVPVQLSMDSDLWRTIRNLLAEDQRGPFTENSKAGLHTGIALNTLIQSLNESVPNVADAAAGEALRKTWEPLLKGLSEELSSTESQKKFVQLQDTLQKVKEILNMASSIQKTMHETSISAIRNLN